MYMKVFVSGQLGEKAAVRRAYAKFRAAGFEVTHDWTRTDNIGDKLLEREESGKRAALDIQGVIDADVYVLMSDNREVGKGMYVELGAALAMQSRTGRPDVFIVGPLNHLSVFYLHPAVRLVESVDDVVSELALLGQ